MSSALGWVRNGRAMAPPACGCRIGVSTSTKCSDSRSRRMAAMAMQRTSNTRRLSGLARRSTSRSTVAGVGLGQSVPLVGQRAQRLGHEGETGDVHRQLTQSGGDDFTLGTHPVAEVDCVEDGRGVLAQRRRLQEELDRTRGVGLGGERQLAVTSHDGHPSGQPHLVAGATVRLEISVSPMEVIGQDRAVEPRGIRVDPPARQLLALLAPLADQGVEGGCRHLVG